jgi:hypothetical protein
MGSDCGGGHGVHSSDRQSEALSADGRRELTENRLEAYGDLQPEEVGQLLYEYRV